ncbi:malate dehydrogenase (quinone) [Saprospiraceae bacterium]|nr:malate dehydrogenase (quinone) [Saprospiraceae bacterium]
MDIKNTNKKIILIGAGIMSATLGVLLKKLMPDAQIQIFERLDKVATESSAAWNNAGTGHSAFCELNYTPSLEDGSIDMTKALRISQQFEESKQMWASLLMNGDIKSKRAFINDIDHMSFVWGEENVEFLRKRYETMVQFPIFEDMLYSEDPDTIRQWIPLMMENREKGTPVAATRMPIGTDVNFGLITKSMIRFLEYSDGVELNLAHEVSKIKQLEDGRWQVKSENLTTDKKRKDIADFVFIGAGGGTLRLLEKTDIPQARGYGGFPVGGEWLRCNNPEIIARHEAKVYGLAAVGAPPMSVPHLDTRMINGDRCLLFGPYASFSTKFLKNGSYLDLFLSLEVHNIRPMLSAGMNNIPLTKYLVSQVMQDKEDKFEYLKNYFPDAKFEEWDVEKAGQRVQIIKKDTEKGGVLKFGTEVVLNDDGSLSALLGASPGASTSVSIMLDLLNKCFPENSKSQEWQETIKGLIPSYGQSLVDNRELLNEIRGLTTRVLKLEDGFES